MTENKPIRDGDEAKTKYIVTTGQKTASFKADDFHIAIAYYTWNKAKKGDDVCLYLANPRIQIA
jgi:hypothetical protein